MDRNGASTVISAHGLRSSEWTGSKQRVTPKNSPNAAASRPPLGALLLLVQLATAGTLSAQTATVQGRVRELDGAAVYGATVVLEREGGVAAVTDTDRLGSFQLSGVVPGAYTLRVQALGYAEHTRPIEPGLAEVLDVDVRLERTALQIEGVSVEAERSRERIRFEELGGITVRELDLRELRAVPGIAEPDPVRAVEVLPGVVSTSDFSAAFHVRGGSQDQNLILLDGIPVFSPFHLGGLFSVFNADMIERVELQSGGFPAEHGGRVSSVLQIESDPGDGELAVDGAVSLLATRAAVGGGLPESAVRGLGLADLRYRASARRSYFDVLLEPAFEFPYHLTDLQGVVEGWTNGGDRIVLSAYTGRDVFDLTTLDAEDFPLRIDWDWGNDVVGLRWSRPRDGGGSLDVRANYSGFSTGLTFPDFADTRLSSRIRQGQLRADLDVRPAERLTTRVGVSAERQSYLNQLSSGGTDFGGGEGRAWLLGAYAQARWSVPLEWLVEAGVRLDHQRPDVGDAVAELAPRVAVKRFVTDDVALKVAVGRYTQFLHSLRDEELPLGLDFWVLAGARAPHTVSDQLQLGIEGYLGADWFWSLEGYARTFDGVGAFNTADDPNEDRDDIVGGEGRSYGLDLLVSRERGVVDGWLALSLLQAERTFPDLLSPLEPRPRVSYPPIFDRRVDLDLVLRYPAPWGWEGGLRWNLGTGIPYTRALGSYAYYAPRYVEGGALEWTGAEESDDPGGYAVVLEDRNRSRYPLYHRLDLSFRRTFRKGWGSLTPYLNLVNVYNRKNVLFYFYEYDRSPPVRSGISMFPVLPTIGLEVRF